MRFKQGPGLGQKANQAVNTATAKVDDQTGEVAVRAAGMIALAVRVLRVPTALLLGIPVPFIVIVVLLALRSEGPAQVMGLVLGGAMAAVSAAFWGRRRRIIQAVDDPDKLATELGIMISLTDKVAETRGALTDIAGGGGWRLFSRLRGVWKGAGMAGHWIEGVGDLPRAKYFGPPKIGTTVTVSVAALWLVPISVVAALLALVGSIAGSF